MAVTQTQIDRLRRDTGTDETSLPDEDIQDIFDEADEKYTDTATAAAYTRVLTIQSLLASSARLATYRQNESSENLSDIFKHLKELLKVWEEKTDDAITAAAGSSGAARFGSVRRKPATIREYPGSF
jgi:gas vesicle protein